MKRDVITLCIIYEDKEFINEFTTEIKKYGYKRNINFKIYYYSVDNLLENKFNKHYYDMIFYGKYRLLTSNKEIYNYIHEYCYKFKIISIVDNITDSILNSEVQIDASLEKMNFKNKLISIFDEFISRIKIGKIYTFKKGNEYFRIDIDEILYFESIKRKIKIYRYDGMIFEYYDKLNNIETTISEKIYYVKFIRCHQSYYVNEKYIKSITLTEIKLFNNNIIPVSKRNKRDAYEYIKSNMVFK